MPSVDYSIQLKFLNELDSALSDALKKHSTESSEKLKELKYMQSEVDRARRVVNARIDAAKSVSGKERSSKKRKTDKYYGDVDKNVQVAI
jgi:Mg2+ and Co2+ transporter CorA